MYVSVKISGDRQFLSKLHQLGPKLNNFSVAFAILGSELRNYYSSKPFASGGGIFGMPWSPLSDSYKRAKGRTYPGRGILEATGHMKSSFTAKVHPTTLIIGNDAPYFDYHQSTEPRSKIPRRPMLGVNTEIKSIVKQIIENDIHEKLRGL